MSLQFEIEEDSGRQVSPEEFLAEQKAAMRKKSLWAIGIGGFLVAAHLLLVLSAFFGKEYEILTWNDLFRSIFFIIGILALGGGVWGLYSAKRLTLKDVIPTPEALEFARQIEGATPYFSYILIGSIIAVTICQYIFGLRDSIDVAGFVKPRFRENGEWWRIVTSATLHSGFLHIYFNAQALYGFGSLIEFLSNRAHLTIVFFLSIIGGGLLSLVFMPDVKSVGASGGIMGLVGYLAIYGYRRKSQLPPDFLKSMLINIGFIAAFGIIAYQFIDNFAHLGGLLVGALYGFIQIPRGTDENPRRTNALVKALGFAALAAFVGFCAFSILLLLKVV